jgi:hypothetical protein
MHDKIKYKQIFRSNASKERLSEMSVPLDMAKGVVLN